MSRGGLALLLALALLASALALVRSAYESRRLFADLDRARVEQGRLDSEHKRLEADAQIQATSVKVDKVARGRLGMREPAPGVTHYVTDRQAALVPNASGAAR